MSTPTTFLLPKMLPPLERCYWVVENRFLAGAYPGGANPTAHLQRITGLWQAGMRTFVNLMEQDEVNNAGKPFTPYQHLLETLALAQLDPVSCLRFPIPDSRITSVEKMRDTLDAIDQSLANNHPVYLHCFGGMGRTGTVVCCWLIRHGFATTQNVLETLTLLRKADRQRATWPAPENELQRRFVLSWVE